MFYSLATANSQDNSHTVPYSVDQENIQIAQYPNFSKSKHIYRNTEHEVLILFKYESKVKGSCEATTVVCGARQRTRCCCSKISEQVQ